VKNTDSMCRLGLAKAIMYRMNVEELTRLQKELQEVLLSKKGTIDLRERLNNSGRKGKKTMKISQRMMMKGWTSKSTSAESLLGSKMGK
jgi:hypothetical protein